MNKRILQIIFLPLFLLFSCNTDEGKNEEFLPFSSDPCEEVIPTPVELRYEAIYDKPEFIELENDLFYSTETVEIQWRLPGDLWNTELQMILTEEPYSCEDYEKFHQLNNEISFGYGNQYVHYFISPDFFSSSQDSVFISYRARTTDIEMVKGYSKWTEVKSFTIAPVTHLNKKTVTVSYTFNFTAEEINHYYYSGVATVSNYRLTEIADDKNLNYDKIRLVRLINLEAAFKTLTDDGDNPFSRLLIGFDENVNPEDTVYPFNVIGEIAPGSFEESPVPGSLYNNLSQNLVSDMNNYDLKVAYALEDEVGSQHTIELHLTYEIYSEN